MFPLGFDQSIRPIVDASVFAPASDEAVKSESFDSHLVRQNETPVSQTPAVPKVTRQEEPEDEPDRDDVPVATATNSPVPPNPEPPAASDEDDASGLAHDEAAAPTDTVDKSLETAGTTKVRKLELSGKLVDQSANQDSPPAVADTQPLEATQSEASTTDLTLDISLANTDAIVDSTLETDKSAQSEPDALAPVSSDTPATVLHESGLTIEPVANVTALTASEEAAVAKAVNATQAKPESRKSKVNSSDVSLPSSNQPANSSTPLKPTVALTNNVEQGIQKAETSDRTIATAANINSANNPQESSTTPTPATSRLVQHLSGGDERAAKGTALAGADQTRFLERIARAFRAAESRQGVVKLRLHPPELGSLRIELRMQNGGLTAKLEAESSSTQSLLIEHAYALRDRLSEQGIRVERFDVDVADHRTMDHSGTFQEHSQQQRKPTTPTPGDQQPETPHEGRGVLTRLSAPVNGKINVII